MATAPGNPGPLPHVDLPATPAIDPHPYEGPTIGPGSPHENPPRPEPPEPIEPPEPVEPPEVEID